VIFSFEKFRHYSIGSHVIFFIDHTTLKHLLSKKDAKLKLVRWTLLLQEFDYEIRDRKGSENLVDDHLCRVLYDRESKSSVSKFFLDEQLHAVHPDPWYADVVDYLIAGRIPEGWTKNDRNRFFNLTKFIIWDDSYLFKYYFDQVFRRCISDNKARSVLSFCHDQPCRGHFSWRKTAAKVLQCGFY